MKKKDEVNPMISIIVPVYNVEDFVLECLGSISRQSYKNIEVIIINDGSIDNSLKLCEDFCLKDSRFSVFTKKNGGLMSAWIDGVNIARGSLLGFVDSDDIIHENMYEILFNGITKYETDVSICEMIPFYDSISLKPSEHQYLLYAKDEIKTHLIPKILDNHIIKSNLYNHSRCNKLFRKELVYNNLNLCNTKISTGEDLNILFPILLDSSKIVLISNNPLYYYRIRNNSIINNYTRNKQSNLEILNSTLRNIEKIKHVNYNEFLDSAFTSMYFDLFYQVVSLNTNYKIKISTLKELHRNLPTHIDFSLMKKKVSYNEKVSFARSLKIFMIKHKMFYSLVILFIIHKKAKKKLRVYNEKR